MIPVMLIMVLLPVLGIVVALLLGRRSDIIACTVSVAEFLLFLFAASEFYSNGGLSEVYQFIPQLSINFDLTLNGISLAFSFLSVVAFLAASLSSMYFMREEKLGYNSLIMLAESAVLGLFLSGNLFILYLFWDLAIIAFFFMLFHFGGYDRRYASIKFIIYSILSSSLLLIGIIMLYFYMPTHTFEISKIIGSGYLIPKGLQLTIFVLLAISFMIKMPIFPFHSWAPDAYSEAPPGSAMLLAGVLSKFGVYGMIILFLSLPIARQLSLYAGIIFALSSLYAALTAINQKNLKRMLSYLSISEIGVIGFAIAAMNVGIDGAIIGSVSHALIISLLFLLTFSIEKLFGTTIIQRLNGIIEGNRVIGYAFLFGVLAAIGLPLTSGFITDLLIFIGGAKSFGFLIVVPALAIIINASYLFWTYERSFFTGRYSEIYDIIDKSIYSSILLLVLFIILIGLLPSVILNSVFI